jgi:hypothetical protein
MPPIEPDPLGPLLGTLARALSMVAEGLIKYQKDRLAARLGRSSKQ